MIKTYSIEDTKKHICEFFNLPSDAFQIKSDEYATYCYLFFPDKENSLQDILKAMDWYGYFCTAKNPKPLENGWYALKFEQKFQENANELLKNEEYIYHITPKVYKEKIMKNGFVPYSRNNSYNYPDRIYFMLGSNSPIDTIVLISQLSVVKYGVDDKSRYCAIRVDVKKIPNRVVFHQDINKRGAIWTTDNIPPSCIVATIDCK